jgi:hypothetical protein
VSTQLKKSWAQGDGRTTVKKITTPGYGGFLTFDKVTKNSVNIYLHLQRKTAQ